MTWLMPSHALTLSQVEGMALGTDRHLLVEGSAGTGKTTLLLHRAAHLAKGQPGSTAKVKLFCFTTVLKCYLASSLRLVELGPEFVSTFDAWCLEVYRTRVGHRCPRVDGHTDFQAVRDEVEASLEEQAADGGLLDVALLDGGQDFPPQVFRILRRAARHVTVAMDPHQRIFEGGASPVEVEESLGPPEASRVLRLEAPLRSGQEVARLSLSFLDDPGERSRALARYQQVRPFGQLPLAYVARDRHDQETRMIGLVRQRMVLGERVGLLLPQSRQAHQVAGLLGEAGIPNELALPPRKQGGNASGFASAVPKVCTYHSATGITFGSVFLPCLDDESFERDRGPVRRRLLYTALARASKWAFLGRTQGLPFEEDPWLGEAERTGRLIVQEGESTRLRCSDSDDGCDPSSMSVPSIL